MAPNNGDTYVTKNFISTLTTLRRAYKSVSLYRVPYRHRLTQLLGNETQAKRFNPKKTLMSRNVANVGETRNIRVYWRVEPLQCNDHEIGAYTTAVSGQRLEKHVPQQHTNITMAQQRNCVFCGPHRGRCYATAW
jgi:hypothetical protein